MRLTTLHIPTWFLALSFSAACVQTPDRDGPRTDGSCDLDDAKVITENYTFRDADDIEDADLPGGCWDLDGTLRLESSGITSLEKLGKLVGVTNLVIENTKLAKLDFAEPVTVYEVLEVQDNQMLTGLDNLLIEQDRAVSITIQDNAALTALAGLADLTKVEGKADVPGDLVIRNNAKLAKIELSQLTEVVGRFEIADNAELANLDGLSDLTTVGGDFMITGNAKLASAKLPRLATIGSSPANSMRFSNNAALTSIDVTSLEAMHRVEISENAALTTFSGFRARQVAGDLTIRNNAKLTSLGSMFSLDAITGHVAIDNNAALSNLGAFTTTLRNITGTLTISNNANLVDLGQLSHLNGIGGTVSIANNTKLPFCKAQEIDHCVTQSGAVSIVGNNNTQTQNCPCWCD